MVDGVTVNFRNSVVARVDYVESAVLFLTLEQVLVELRVLVCIDLHLC